MRIAKVEVFLFSELSEEAQEKAINKYRESALDYDWYEPIYEDARTIGLEITSFDCYKHKIKGKFVKEPESVAHKILYNYGDSCETYGVAVRFIKAALGLDKEGEAFSDLTESFRRDLLRSYLRALKQEAEYLQSDDAVRETIDANDWEFTEDGRLFSLREFE
jgi:hypothetical protein